MGRTGEAITGHLPPSMRRLLPQAAFTGIPVHSASAASGSAAVVVTGTMAGTTGTVTTGIGMTAEGTEGTGTVPRAEGIQVAMDGIAEVWSAPQWLMEAMDQETKTLAICPAMRDMTGVSYRSM